MSMSFKASPDGTYGEILVNGQVVAKLPVAGNAVIPNLVGTVSQSGGIPTGAIVERGSNANGEYVRFADGTQICTATVSITIASAVAEQVNTLTFPATFSSNPYHAISFDSVHISQGRVLAANSSVGIGSSGLSNATYGYRPNVSGLTTLTQNIRYTAIGRWF